MRKKAILALSLLTSILFAGSSMAEPTAPTPKPQTAPTQQQSVNPALTKEDLPTGFQDIPPELKAQVISQVSVFLQQQLPGATLKPENLFAFFNPENSEAVIGYTDQLATQPSQAQFDATIKRVQQPESQQMLTSALKAKLKTLKDVKVELVEYKTLTELSNVANNSTGVTLALKVEDLPVRLDMVTFRRNAVAAVTAVVYMDGKKPVAAVGDVARKLDGRILQSAPAANRSRLAIN